MTTIDHITIEATDPSTAEAFYRDALGLDEHVQVRQADDTSSGFRGCTLSLVTDRPATVDALIEAAAAAGATVVKPATKSLWGYGGTVQAPDGTVVTLASATKKDAGPATGRIDNVVLQLGVEDVAATKQFYADRGLRVGKSYGRKYVEFETGTVTLALLKRRGLAKAAGVPPEGSGPHRVAVASAAGSFTDPDGFVWEESAS